MRSRTFDTTVKLTVVVLVLACTVVTSAAGIDRLYRPEDRPVADLARLYRVAGVAFPTASFPVSRAWLHATARSLRPHVDGPAYTALNRYLDDLDYRPREVKTMLQMTVSPELYVERAYLRESITEKLRRQSAAGSLAVSGSLDGGPLLHTRIDAIPRYSVEHLSNVSLPSSGAPVPYEFNNLPVGYLHVPIGLLNVTFGRQQQQLGPGTKTSVALSPFVPYLDALRITLELGPIRMHHNIASIDNTRSTVDVTLPESTLGLYNFKQNQIFFNTHYFEYRFNRLRAGIGGHIVVSRYMNNFTISDFFPVFSWHNAKIHPINMSLFLDLTVTPAPGVEVYGQLGLDDINTNAIGVSDAAAPTIPAFVIGSRYTTLGDTGTLDLSMDVGMTHYLYGNYASQFGLSRAIYRTGEGWTPGYTMPLTSPFGPGTVFTTAAAELEREQIGGSLRYSFVAKKPDANLLATPYEPSEALRTQPYVASHRVELAVRYAPTPWAALDVRPGLFVSGGTAVPYVDLGGTVSYGGSYGQSVDNERGRSTFPP